MEKKRRLWKKFFVSAVVASAIAGCGFDQEQKTEKREETILTVFTDGEQPAADNKIYRQIKEELGVGFEFITYTGDGNNERKSMTATGNYPDILDASDLIIDRGGALPLEGLLPDYPNLYKHYEPYLDLMKANDGHIYILPDYGVVQGEEPIKTNWRSGFFIQKAVLAEFGYPEIKTLEEYFDLIEQYMEKYPELYGKPTIGYTICNDGTFNYGLVNPPALLAGYPNNANCLVDTKTNVASDFRTDEISRRFYRKLCEEYEKGVIDPEACLLSYEQYIARLSEGNVLGFADELWNVNDANVYLGQRGMEERAYISIPLVYEEGIREQYMDYNPVSTNSGYMISVNCKTPEKVLELFDTLLEEKWQKLMTWGIEGEDYLVDEAGRFYRTQEMRIEQYAQDWTYSNSAVTLYDHLPKIQGVFSDGNAASVGTQPREFQETLTEYSKEFLDHYGKECWGDFFLDALEQPPYFPTWSFTPTDGTVPEIAASRAAACNASWLPRLITCGKDAFASMWEGYCSEYEKTGYENFIAYINECIQETLS